MPVLSITVTSEVIQHANNIIQEGRGYLVLARVADRWEFVPITECADEFINEQIAGRAEPLAKVQTGTLPHYKGDGEIGEGFEAGQYAQQAGRLVRGNDLNLGPNKVWRNDDDHE